MGPRCQPLFRKTRSDCAQTHAEMHAEISRGRALKVASCDARSVRRIAMCFAKRIAHPITGMFRISAFEMYLDAGIRCVVDVW